MKKPLDGFSLERMEMLADRLTTRITSLEIHERTGNISSIQQETLDAFRIALEVLAVNQAQPAAPQLPGSDPATMPGGWIPVSERMPERGDYLVSDGCDFDVQLFNGEQFIPGFVWEDGITHWMPLPAGPKELK